MERHLTGQLKWARSCRPRQGARSQPNLGPGRWGGSPDPCGWVCLQAMNCWYDSVAVKWNRTRTERPGAVASAGDLQNWNMHLDAICIIKKAIISIDMHKISWDKQQNAFICTKYADICSKHAQNIRNYAANMPSICSYMQKICIHMPLYRLQHAKYAAVCTKYA